MKKKILLENLVCREYIYNIIRANIFMILSG